ncbi:MAG TPA: terminase family protein [Allosphingosinicella sp.]|nr:terminase family protein [Allosphingosinicella sp.]
MKAEEVRLLRAVERLARLDPEERRWAVARLTEPQKRALNEFWPAWAHEGQQEPPEAGAEKRVWLLLAGRGFGKTRAGAEWVSQVAREQGGARIALVGATLDDVRKVMIEGRSGLIAVAGTGETIDWTPSTGRLVFPSGAEAFAYSGENPEKLRGPEHHFAWCDEIAKWRYPDAAWDNLQLGLRLGKRPRALVTTTPRPIGLVRRLIASGAVTRGRTADNPHLAPSFVEEMSEAYGGTRLGRQELDGELVEDVEGALWTREMIERCRAPSTTAFGGGPPPRAGEDMRRVVIGVDPPASAGGTCGIVACGLGADGTGYVLGDHSVRGLSPEGWARTVAYAAELHGADRVVAESNQGGEMVESVLRSADVALPVRPAHARYGKGRRAEPVAILFVKGKAKLAGAFPELEDELCGLTLGNGYEGPGTSPDRADAMVWALTELMLGKAAKVPRIRML